MLKEVANCQYVFYRSDILMFRSMQGYSLPISGDMERTVMFLDYVRQGREQRPHVVPLQVVSGWMAEDGFISVLVAAIQLW